MTQSDTVRRIWRKPIYIRPEIVLISSYTVYSFVVSVCQPWMQLLRLIVSGSSFPSKFADSTGHDYITSTTNLRLPQSGQVNARLFMPRNVSKCPSLSIFLLVSSTFTNSFSASDHCPLSTSVLARLLMLSGSTLIRYTTYDLEC